MVASLGIDIIEIERIRKALQRWPRMAARLFTEGERAYCDRRAEPAPHYAARFAAKEAAAKALGRWLRWHEVEILTDSAGRPSLSLSGEAAELAHVSQGGRLLVSLSHSRDYAVACVLLFSPQEIACPDENLPPGRTWT
jgi:holo-[acyl-carrier protein] synthase